MVNMFRILDMNEYIYLFHNLDINVFIFVQPYWPMGLHPFKKWISYSTTQREEIKFSEEN